MPQLLMRENSPMPEYHGEFDCLVGQKSPELNIEVALKLARRFPEVFEPIGFSVEDFKEDTLAVTKGNLMNIRFIYNPLFPEYHSASGIDFNEVGEEKALTFGEAKQLLERFPSAFELVDSDLLSKNDEAEVEAVEENPTLDQQILELVKEVPHSFDELQKKIDIPFNQLRGRVISLGKNKQIVKDDDEKWVIVK